MSERRASVPPRHQAVLEALQRDHEDEQTLVGIPAPLHLPAAAGWAEVDDTVVIDDPDALRVQSGRRI